MKTNECCMPQPKPSAAPCPKSPVPRQEVLAKRFVEMGLSRSLPSFPPDGVPLVRLGSWWRLWPYNPRKNTLEPLGAAVLPAVDRGILNLKANAPVNQSVFAAMLPIQRPESAVEDWIGWTITSIIDGTCPGPSPLLGILEPLLQQQPETERTSAWLRILESSCNKKGAFCEDSETEGIALLEAVGRSGLPGLAPCILGVLHNRSRELVLAAITCLARLGCPDNELPAEVLLNHFRPESMERGRWALAFLESGDLDVLTGLLRTPAWGERVQALRLAEAVLLRGGPAGQAMKGWREGLVDLLLAQIQEEDDFDVVRCLAVTLGLALRQADEAELGKAFEYAASVRHKRRMESVLNALLLAELPNSAATLVEKLRPQAAKMDSHTVEALNRVLLSMGVPSGSVQDWLAQQVVVFLRLGVLRLPDPIRPWFTAPESCPGATVASLLAARPDSDLTLTLSAAYLAERPEFLPVLERIWIEAAYGSRAETMKAAGALLAGAAENCSVSPVELRCSLGAELGGPLEESPEVIGRLLGLVITQDKEVRQSAEQLLLCMSLENRTIAQGCLRWKEPPDRLFSGDRQSLVHSGSTAASIPPARALPEPLQPVFSGRVALHDRPRRALEALVLPNKQCVSWARECLEWDNAEALGTALSELDSTVLASAFLESSAGRLAEARQMAGLLAAAAGPRLLETPHSSLLVQRVIYLAAHDPDNQVRVAGRQAAEALGISDQVPATPAPPPPPVENTSGAPGAGPGDMDLEELLGELESGLND